MPAFAPFAASRASGRRRGGRASGDRADPRQHLGPYGAPPARRGCDERSYEIHPPTRGPRSRRAGGASIRAALCPMSRRHGGGTYRAESGRRRMASRRDARRHPADDSGGHADPPMVIGEVHGLPLILHDAGRLQALAIDLDAAEVETLLAVLAVLVDLSEMVRPVAGGRRRAGEGEELRLVAHQWSAEARRSQWWRAPGAVFVGIRAREVGATSTQGVRWLCLDESCPGRRCSCRGVARSGGSSCVRARRRGARCCTWWRRLRTGSG